MLCIFYFSALLYKNHVSVFADDKLAALMNGDVRTKLRVIPKNVTWGGQSSAVFKALTEDFMKPVTKNGKPQKFNYLKSQQ